MNKEFVKKMLQAKKLEYEALEEILPDCIKEKRSRVVSDIKDIIRDVIIEDITEDKSTKNREVKKVNIDFN
ncbi:hypothetical protein KQI30_13645 [Clostridium bornimense]|uniref:hypothetical protein n=1 Tax=Clostridium bornimense TaxID=1216932 RepID=UPI001C123075|nr:hypothetical protein [Clostridium bornimense]MBU5317295.1 hypothetical protein [Clostridium bornimense]